MRNQIFLMSYPEIFFLPNLHFGPNRWFARRFLKISIIYSQNLHFDLVFLSIFQKFHRTLSIRGTNFRACSASGKMWTVFTCTIHAEHTRNEFYRTLSISGANFIACWAYAETISSCLKVEYLGRIEYDFQKSCVSALGIIRFQFLQKSYKKNFMLVYL